MRSKAHRARSSASLIGALAQRDDCAVDLKQRDRASVAVDGGPILSLDEGDELAGAAMIFEFDHQPLEHSAMHTGERFLQLLAVPASPGAQEMGAVGERLQVHRPLLVCGWVNACALATDRCCPRCAPASWFRIRVL